MKKWQDIDWGNPKEKITENFTVHEALWLPSYKVYHIPSVYERMNLVDLLNKVQEIRSRINVPFNVISCMRPNSVRCFDNECCGNNYNLYVNGAKHSPHMYGCAIDFLVGVLTECGHACLRQRIVPWLEVLGLRMEDKDECKIHLDTYPVINCRFFKP